MGILPCDIQRRGTGPVWLVYIYILTSQQQLHEANIVDLCSSLAQGGHIVKVIAVRKKKEERWKEEVQFVL